LKLGYGLKNCNNLFSVDPDVCFVYTCQYLCRCLVTQTRDVGYT